MTGPSTGSASGSEMVAGVFGGMARKCALNVSLTWAPCTRAVLWFAAFFVVDKKNCQSELQSSSLQALHHVLACLLAGMRFFWCS